VEDWETGTDEGPVYSYTRQQLSGATIFKHNAVLYKRMEELQTKISLVVAGLQPTQEEYLEAKDAKSFDISLLAVIPSKKAFPK